MYEISSIYLPEVKGYPHTQVFDEMIISFEDAFKTIGMPVDVVRSLSEAGDSPLIFGAHLISKEVDIPRDSVIYNLEQSVSAIIDDTYLSRMSKHRTLDYSPINIRRLYNKYDIESTYLPIRYSPALDGLIPKAEQKDIDVVMYGSYTPRRKAMIEFLGQSGVPVTFVSGYGRDRDAIIGRAHLVLDVRSYKDYDIFNIVRASYLFCNGIPYLGEYGAESDQYYPEGLIYERIPMDIGLVLDDVRKGLAYDSYTRFKNQGTQAQVLKETLERMK